MWVQVMSQDFCKDCGVFSRNPCSQYKGRNRFDGCYNLSEEEQLRALGDKQSLEILELREENARLKSARR